MLFEMLARQARDRANRAAFVCGAEPFTWEQWLGAAEDYAAELTARGVGSGMAVAVMLPNSRQMLTAVLALLRVGACPLTLPADLTPAELRQILSAAGSSSVIDGGGLRHEPMAGSAPAGIGAAPGSVLLVSSGTTGLPKVIARRVDHLGALAAAYCEAIDLSAADRILCLVPLAHGQGLCTALLASLHSGATVFIDRTFDRRRALAALREWITVAVGVPFQYGMLAATVRDSSIAASALRYAFSGGSPLPERTWRLVREKLGLPLRQCYGCSETGMLTANTDADAAGTRGSVGRPLPGVCVRTEGSRGAIEATPAAPPGAADGWVATGDRGYIDSAGLLHVTGRTGYLLSIAGRKLAPAEVESVLMSHPAVERAVVTAIARESGEDGCTAEVYCSRPCAADDLAAYCRVHLAGYKIPDRIRVKQIAESAPPVDTGN